MWSYRPAPEFADRFRRLSPTGTRQLASEIRFLGHYFQEACQRGRPQEYIGKLSDLGFHVQYTPYAEITPRSALQL